MSVIEPRAGVGHTSQRTTTIRPGYCGIFPYNLSIQFLPCLSAMCRKDSRQRIYKLYALLAQIIPETATATIKNGQRRSPGFIIAIYQAKLVKNSKLWRYEHRNGTYVPKKRPLLWADMWSWDVARCLEF